ncbi:MAG: hypothetical protein C5B50_15495 [Verrucomicrobia bacterium]|nr:MAG: hypothetical protein C5B50_15495 [Verrucomicrobiota bacterium]
MKYTHLGKDYSRTVVAQHFLKRIMAGLAFSIAFAACTRPAFGAAITWQNPETVLGDTDVTTGGTLIYAYNFSSAASTVNGVAFTGNTSLSGAGANLSFSPSFGANFGGYGSSLSPYNSISTAYKVLLGNADFLDASGASVTITLNNLTVGHSYAVQVWVSDSRSSARQETLSSSGGNTVTLTYDATGGAGGVGQYSIGTFTANATTQSFTLTQVNNSGDVQINALQLRDTTAGIIAWGAPTTIVGDTDVTTVGTLTYAYDFSSSGSTVNGVAFTANTSTSGAGANISFSPSFGANFNGYGSTSNPYNALSTAYKVLLGNADFLDASGASVTITLNNLTSGHSYAVQYWVNDARGSSRQENLSSTGGNTVTLSYDSTGSGGGVGQYSIGTFTAGATTQSFTVTQVGGANDVQINSIQVRDTTPITKAASGTDLTAGASWTGGVAPASGNIAAWASTSLGTGLTIGSALSWLGISAPSAASDIAITGGGVLTLGSSGFDMSAAANNFSAGNPITLGASQTWTVNSGKTLTASGTVSGQTGLLLRKIGSGTLTFSGTTDNNSLRAQVSAGAMILGKTSSSSVHSVGSGGGTDYALTVGGGTAQLGGSGGDQIYDNSAVNITAGTFDMNGKNETFDGLAGTGGTIINNAASTTSTLTLGANNSSGSPAFSGTIASGSGTLALTKIGTGTQTLSAANTYSGATAVNAGTLALGAGGAIGSSAVTVSSGATLANSTTSSTTVGAATLNSGALASFTAAGGVSSAVGQISVTGALTLNNNTLTINVSGSALASGSYRLLSCSGTVTGSANPTPTITGTALPAGYNATIVTTAGSSGHVDLIVNTAPTITTQPAAQSVCNGSTATFTAVASGASPSYAWLKHANTGWGSAWTVGSSSGGTYLGSSANNNNGGANCNSFSGSADINTPGGNSWGLYGGSGGTGESLKRTFPSALTSGQVFQIDMDNGGVDSGKQNGFSLQTGGTFLFSFYFLGGGSFYGYTDSTGNHLTSIGFTRNGLRVTVIIGSGSPASYTLIVLPCGGTASSYAGTFSAAGAPDTLVVFNNNTSTGSANDLFFNNVYAGASHDTADNYSGNWAGADKGDQPIAGATSSTFSTSTGSNGDLYYAIAYNNAGIIASSTAQLTIKARPTAVASGSATICNGSSTTISAALTGTGPWNVGWSDGVNQNGVSASPATRSVSPSATTTYAVTNLTDANCTAQAGDLTGNAVVTVNARPTSVASGSTAICSGSSTTISAALTGTGPWNVRWSDGVNQNGVSASPATRSVSPLSTTSYAVTNLSDANCTAQAGDLTGNAVVTVNALPTAFNVTGGGAFCSGGLGVSVGLDNSGSGINYQLLRNGAPVGSPLAGTGSALSFGPQTNGGTYTVVATSGSTSCSNNMSGSATVIPALVDPLKWVDSNGPWVSTTAGSWQDGATNPATYCDGFDVLLDDSASTTSPTISLNTTVAPTSLTNNSTKNYTITGSGSISGSGGLTKKGTSTLTLNVGGLFTGNTFIGAGTLALGANGSITNSANILVGSNATFEVSALTGGFTLGAAQTLKGYGTVNGSVTANGTVSPGASIGTLTVTTNLTLGGTAFMEINNATIPKSDQLIAGGSLALGGALTVANLGPTLNAGDAFTLFSAASVSGSFSSVTLPALGSGQNWWTTNNYVSLVVNQLTAAPVTYIRAKDFSLKIKIADLLTNVSVLPAGADTFTLAGAGPSTNGASITTNSAYVFYSPTNNLPETFAYAVADARGGSARGFISILVQSFAGGPQTITVTGATATVQFAGIPNYQYLVQRSTNLVSWVTLETTNAPPAGLWSFTDNFSDLDAPPPAAYYRTAQP